LSSLSSNRYISFLVGEALFLTGDDTFFRVLLLVGLAFFCMSIMSIYLLGLAHDVLAWATDGLSNLVLRTSEPQHGLMAGDTATRRRWWLPWCSGCFCR